MNDYPTQDEIREYVTNYLEELLAEPQWGAFTFREDGEFRGGFYGFASGVKQLTAQAWEANAIEEGWDVEWASGLRLPPNFDPEKHAYRLLPPIEALSLGWEVKTS